MPQRRQRKSYAFITGFPGFIGKRLVHHLAQCDDQCEIGVLVLQKFEEQARRYIASLPGSQRIHLFVGDVVDIDMGLSGDEYNHLTANITEFYHLAAISYPGVSPEYMRRVNVHGTQNSLEFAAACKKLKRYCYFSTCYVSGTRQGVILENELGMGQRFRNAYEYTKYMAEVEVERAKASIPISIIRPPIVVGDSRTGQIDRFDGLYYMAMLVAVSPVALPIPLPGEAIAPLNIIPVDYLLKAALHITHHKKGIGRTFHVVDPNPLSSRRVYEIVAARVGKKLSPLPLNSKLLSPLMRLPLFERFARVPGQAIDYLNNLCIYNNDNTLELLDGTGITCPRFESYVDVLIKYVKEHYKD